MQSLTNRKCTFIVYISDQSPISVICIQESWARSQWNGYELFIFSIPNYTLVNQNRRLSTHGGLITYIHNDFAYRELNNELPYQLLLPLYLKASL